MKSPIAITTIIAYLGICHLAVASPMPEAEVADIHLVRVDVQGGSEPNIEARAESTIEARSTNVLAYLFSSTCSGNVDFEWVNAGTGCFEFWDSAGNQRDMYSISLGNCGGALFAGNGCSGASTGINPFLCNSRGGASIKSFFLTC